MNRTASSVVYYCSNVGGGIFGGWQVLAWRALGIDARLHYAVELEAYWRAKSGFWSRLKLRWSMYVWYPILLWQAVRSTGSDTVFVAVTNPFFLPGLSALAARRGGAKTIQLVYDLYPDALIFGGGWSSRHPGARCAAATTRYAIKYCHLTVYLGDRLRTHAETIYGRASRTAVIPVGTDTAPFKDCEPKARQRSVVNCIYSGHMGRLHDWLTLGEALFSGVPENVMIEIAADGPGANLLKEYLLSGASPQPLFSGTRDSKVWRSVMLAADVALVTMRPGAEKVVMPSKAYSAMAAGQAVLAICPRESDLADLIIRHDCGWVVEPGDVARLRELMAVLPSMGGEILAKRRNAYTAAHACYSMEAVGQQWAKLIRSLNEE